MSDEPEDAMTYPANNLPTLRCWRCAAVADVEWHDISTFARQGEVVMGRMLCTTPGCVDEDGTAATSATPPSPRDIQRKADAAMARFYAA